MTNLEVLLGRLAIAHRERYANDSSEMAPMIMTFKDNVILNIYVVPNLMSPEIKPLTHSIIEQMVHDDGAEGYVLHSEAWMSTDTTCMPSDSPDRVEVIIMNGFTARSTAFMMLEIVRGENENVVELRDHENNRAVDMWSRFDIYSRQPTSTVH